MKFIPNEPPRVFQIPAEKERGGPVSIADCGQIHLEANEQVTVLTESQAEYDVARKSWGFYATPSLNSRLTRFGLRAVLMKCPEAKSAASKYFVYLVETGKESEFQDYIDQRGYSVVWWLDTTEALIELEQRLNSHDAP